MIDIEKSRAICDAATPGPWDAGYYQSVNTLFHKLCNMTRDEDAAFVAHARTALPKALDELEAARAEVELFRKRCGALETALSFARSCATCSKRCNTFEYQKCYELEGGRFVFDEPRFYHDGGEKEQEEQDG